MWQNSDSTIRIWIIIGSLFLLLIASVDAGEAIVVDPNAITFNSTTGDIVTRTVIISATDNVTGLMVLTTDLLEKSGTKIIPQQAILTPPITPQMSTSNIQQIPIHFNLANVSGGLYTGEVWLASSSNGTVKIPVTATIKDGLFWPLIILCATILLSYLLFCYKSGMKRNDEIQRTLNIIKESVDFDEKLKIRIQYDRKDVDPSDRPNPYYDQISYEIKILQEKLKIGTALDAETSLTQLQTDWNTWNTSRGQLIGLLEGFSKFITDLNSLEQQILNDGKSVEKNLNSEKVNSIKEIRCNLQETFDTVLQDQGQTKLKEALKKGIDNHIVLIRIVNSLNKIEEICPKKEQKKYIEWRETSWSSLKTCDWGGITDLDIDVTKQLNKAKELHDRANRNTLDADNKGEEPLQSPRYLEFGEFPNNPSPPSNWAGTRLNLYYWGSFLSMVSIIALIGFSQLYLSNPTFGANLNDYTTLGLWGLLVGSSAQTISDKFQGKVVGS
jgi:hypothetical protein